MGNIFWPKALMEACPHAYHPVLHYDSPKSIVVDCLCSWGNYPADTRPLWESTFDQERDDDGYLEQDIFPILQRVLRGEEEEDRLFALFLLGGLATPEARDLLMSFLASPQRKERWASAISLGRLKEERVFAVLHTLLLEGFAAHEIFASVEQWHATQEDGSLYRRTAEKAENLWHIFHRLRNIDYEWYMRQRSECALVLGDWGHPAAVPSLKEALQAAWRMEQDWPNYEGPDESGPDIWYVFQDRLAFALGQVGTWDALGSLHLPEAHLLVARIYLTLGSLQVRNPSIFYRVSTNTLFRDTPWNVKSRDQEAKGLKALPFTTLFVDPARVKPLLGEHFGLSPAEQDDALARFSSAWYERRKEIPQDPPAGQWPVGDLSGDHLSRADLPGADLSGADLPGANLYDADLSGADLHFANLNGADLSSADLRGTDLHNVDLHRAWLQETILYEADLSGADLTRTDLSGADLKGATLSGADLTRATLSGADVSGANLSDANLSGAILHRTRLTKATLSGAILYETNLSRADLSGADLSGAAVTRTQLTRALSLTGSILPDGSTHPV